MIPNPLAAEEPAICRRVNEIGIEDLRRVVMAQNQIEMDDPRLVGVDPFGLDVRGRFEITRIAFDAEMTPSEDATEAVTEFLRSGG
jgi:hypothetical protein